jgi:hypothetical protein
MPRRDLLENGNSSTHAGHSDPEASMNQWPLRILLTNHHLQSFGGTETYTLTLADALLRRGHEVTVYSKFAEALAPELARRGVALVTDLGTLKQGAFEVAHVHHNICAYEVRHCFPELPLVYVSHGVLPFLESAPIVDLGISRFVAVSEEVEERLLQEGIARERLRLCRNVVDDGLFSPSLEPLPARPRRALVLSNRIDPSTEAEIGKACERSGVQCLVMGARTTPVDYRELPALLRCADLVFTLGRGAVETMLCGRIPFILDINGGDGLVTPGNVYEIMRCNLSGRRFSRRFDADAIMKELEDWRPANGPELRDIAVKEFGAASRAAELEGIYRQAVSEGLPPALCRTASDVTRTVVESVWETLGQANNSWQARAQADGLQSRPARLQNLSEALLSAGWLDAARAVLESLLAESPGHVLAITALAYIKIVEGRHIEAHGLLQSALEREPNNPAVCQMVDFLRADYRQKAEVNPASQSPV